MDERIIRVLITEYSSSFYGQEGTVLSCIGGHLFKIKLDEYEDSLAMHEFDFTWLGEEY
jgi:hypothetical protein